MYCPVHLDKSLLSLYENKCFLYQIVFQENVFCEKNFHYFIKISILFKNVKIIQMTKEKILKIKNKNIDLNNL